jgi:hypothetical protein
VTRTVRTTAPSTARAAVAPIAGLYEAAITDAKNQWLTASLDGSPSARVQRLYEAYRDLVIRQAAAVQGRAASAS